MSLSQKKNIFIACMSFILSILFFALYNQWIVITLPSHKKIDYTVTTIMSKKIILFYFNNEKWNNEEQELLWSENPTKNTHQLINAWLTLLDEERIISKKVTLQTALLSTSGTMYLSFDHNFLSKKDTIFKKWMLIEGLLKTLHNNDIPIQSVQLLMQHQQLIDHHIDFSSPWPLQGFLM